MAEVVQGRGDVDGEREVLLLLQPPVAADQAGEPRAVDVLEHDVRTVAVLPVPEAAHDHGVVDRGEGEDLPAQAAPGGLVLELGGTQRP